MLLRNGERKELCTCQSLNRTHSQTLMHTHLHGAILLHSFLKAIYDRFLMQKLKPLTLCSSVQPFIQAYVNVSFRLHSYKKIWDS